MSPLPLHGLRVLELGGIGPVPHAAMTLADWGADVVRLERPDADVAQLGTDTMMRNRRILLADLKREQDLDLVQQLAGSADVLLDCFRPGVAERLGLGPEPLLEANPRLVYGRLTGWGQTGPLAHTSAHDINLLAVSGVLEMMGPAEQPAVPLNLVGDYGGGSMLMVSALLAALLQRVSTGRGQVIDVAMLEGIAHLSHTPWTLERQGMWQPERGSNLLDGAAPFYTTYQCADGRFLAIGAIEEKFYADFVRALDLADEALEDRWDRAQWPALRQRFAQRIVGRGRDEWTKHFAGFDACVTPVLTRAEAVDHPHLRERGVYAPDALGTVPAPAPRFEAEQQVGRIHPPTIVAQPQRLAEEWAAAAGREQKEQP